MFFESGGSSRWAFSLSLKSGKIFGELSEVSGMWKETQGKCPSCTAALSIWLIVLKNSISLARMSLSYTTGLDLHECHCHILLDWTGPAFAGLLKPPVILRHREESKECQFPSITRRQNRKKFMRPQQKRSIVQLSLARTSRPALATTPCHHGCDLRHSIAPPSHPIIQSLPVSRICSPSSPAPSRRIRLSRPTQ